MNILGDRLSPGRAAVSSVSTELADRIQSLAEYAVRAGCDAVLLHVLASGAPLRERRLVFQSHC